MGRGKQLSQKELDKIDYYYQRNVPKCEIARKLNRSVKVVSNYLKRKGKYSKYSENQTSPDASTYAAAPVQQNVARSVDPEPHELMNNVQPANATSSVPMAQSKTEPDYYFVESNNTGDDSEEEDLYDGSGTLITSEYLNDEAAKSPNLQGKYTILYDSQQQPLYKCLICAKVQHNTGHLVGHIRTHTGVDPFICKVCGRSFSNSTRLKLHLRVHTIKRPGSAAINTPSPASTVSPLPASSNLAGSGTPSDDNERPHQCVECKEFFPKNVLYLHMKEHLQQKNNYVEKTVDCEQCCQKFGSSVALKHHQSSAHPRSSILLEALQSRSPRTLSPPELLPRQQYASTYGAPTTVKTESTTSHVTSNPILSKLLTREVPELPAQTSFGMQLEQNVKVEQPSTVAPPDLMEGGFIISAVATVDHSFLERLEQMEQRKHQATPPQDSLPRLQPVPPVRSLTKVAPLQCGICGKLFHEPFGLRQHTRAMHREVKPHKCKECGKMFAHERNMYIHMRVHVGMRPFTCIICFKTFTRSAALNGHMASHTYGKIRCVKCSEVLPTAHNYTKHVEAHHPDFLHQLDKFVEIREKQRALRKELMSTMKTIAQNRYSWKDRIGDIATAGVAKCETQTIDDDECVMVRSPTAREECKTEPGKYIKTEDSKTVAD